MSKQHIKEETLKLTSLFAWIGGSFFLFIGFISLVSDPVAGIFLLLAGISIFPLFWKVIKQRLRYTAPRTVKIALFVVFFFLFVAVIPKTSESAISTTGTTIAKKPTLEQNIQTSQNKLKQNSPDTSNIPPKVLGSCSTASTGNYVITNCVNIQLPNSSSPSRLVYIVIDPATDSPKTKLQTVATQASTLCGSISDCTIDIFDDTQAANEEYKEDLLSQAAESQYIHDPKNGDAVTSTTDHLVATFTPPSNLTYLFMPSPTPSITPTPVAYDANGFPEDAQQVTVADIAKVPSAYDGKKVTFTCTVLSFPKDSSGNAAGLNCSDPNDYSSILQVQMGTFDESVKVNQNDSVVIYGIGQGSASGQNAFGGQVNEAVVLEVHLKDFTTRYNE